MDKQSTATRLSQLEILFSEQEYTVEQLNTVITRQAQDIDDLSTQLELLKIQFRDLKSQIPDNPVVDEKPPHY